MKLGFVCRFDPENSREYRRALSGIIWHMLEEFKAQGVEIEFIGPIRGSKAAELLEKAIRGINKLFKLKRPLRYDCNPLILHLMAKEIQNCISGKKLDAILAQDLTRMAYVDLDIPIFYWRDANFMDLHLTYKGYKKTHPVSIEWGHEQERRAMNNAKKIFFSSECSYQTAVSFYDIPANKVKVIPMGANHQYNLTFQDIEKIIEERSNNRCNLLFFGIDWYRKGGDIALEVCRILNQNGLPCQLNVIGGTFPIDKEIQSQVKFHGFVNKYTEDGQKTLKSLLENSHFLIHPARAEAYGCVLPEACSFGIPCLVSHVGGLPTIVKNDRNGYVFPIGSQPQVYAKCIHTVFSDFDRYVRLGKSTFKEYEFRLNWKVAVREAIDNIQASLMNSNS